MAVELVLNTSPLTRLIWGVVLVIRSNVAKKIIHPLLSLGVIVSGFVSATPAHAAITLPTGSFQPCSSGVTNYCIESVSITKTGQKPIVLVWTPAGTSGPSAGNNTGVVAGKATLPGRWTAPGAFDSNNYDGIYIDAKAANAFVPWVYVDTQPTLSSGGGVNLAAQASNTNYAVNLDSEAAIDIKIHTGDIKPGVTFGVGTDATLDIQSASGYSTVEISGYPVSVPLAKSTKDCTGDAGVATALVTQFQSVIVPANDPLGFSVDGASGKMYVGSNGICKLSTPTWDAEKKAFKYSASAPKLAPDGTTTNKGFYHAVISFADATALWGLKNPADAASALVVSITTTAGGSVAATKAVSARNNQIIIDVSGFNFPDPLLDITLNPDYNMNSTAVTKPLVTGTPKPTPSPTVAPKKITVTCVKGVITKKITAVNAACPAGYKKK
jgi:hypothetical protein